LRYNWHFNKIVLDRSQGQFQVCRHTLQRPVLLRYGANKIPLLDRCIAQSGMIINLDEFNSISLSKWLSACKTSAYFWVAWGT
jgi:hypothetical protein